MYVYNPIGKDSGVDGDLTLRAEVTSFLTVFVNYTLIAEILLYPVYFRGAVPLTRDHDSLAGILDEITNTLDNHVTILIVNSKKIACNAGLENTGYDCEIRIIFGTMSIALELGVGILDDGLVPEV